MFKSCTYLRQTESKQDNLYIIHIFFTASGARTPNVRWQVEWNSTNFVLTNIVSARTKFFIIISWKYEIFHDIFALNMAVRYVFYCTLHKLLFVSDLKIIKHLPILVNMISQQMCYSCSAFINFAADTSQMYHIYLHCSKYNISLAVWWKGRITSQIHALPS